MGKHHFHLSPDNKRNATMICPLQSLEYRDDEEKEKDEEDAVNGYKHSDKNTHGTTTTIPVFHKKVSLENGPTKNTPARKKLEFDHDVHAFLTQSTDRVLAIFNIGAHYHTFEQYQQDLHAMLDLLSDTKRHQDLYFFRSTSPGHEGCLPRTRKFDWKHGTRIVPLTKFEEYKVTVGHQYDWDKFEGYNHYTKTLLFDRNRKGTDPIFHYLDIFNMTALRHDAHAAPSDCLHFQAPGPVDWWNHLLFTYLKQLSKNEKVGKHNSIMMPLINCRRSYY